MRFGDSSKRTYCTAYAHKIVQTHQYGRANLKKGNIVSQKVTWFLQKLDYNSTLVRIKAKSGRVIYKMGLQFYCISRFLQSRQESCWKLRLLHPFISLWCKHNAKTRWWGFIKRSVRKPEAQYGHFGNHGEDRRKIHNLEGQFMKPLCIMATSSAHISQASQLEILRLPMDTKIRDYSRGDFYSYIEMNK